MGRILSRKGSHLVEINDDPDDLIGNAEDNLEEVNLEEVDNKDSDDEEDDNPREVDEPRPNWMLLSEMMPNRQTHNLNDLIIREIDRNHDWVNESRLRYAEIEEAESFIQQAIGNSELTSVGNNSANIE